MVPHPDRIVTTEFPGQQNSYSHRLRKGASGDLDDGDQVSFHGPEQTAGLILEADDDDDDDNFYS